MTGSTKISTCVDCGVALLGDGQRCSACHARHAAASNADDGVTAPRHRRRAELMPNYLVRWLVTVEVIGIIGLALVLVVRGCS